MTHHYITLGDGAKITAGQYCAIIRSAKRKPDEEWFRSLRDRWPSTGRAIRREFLEDMVTDHCNRGLTIYPSRDSSHYLARRIKAGKIRRECKWCGQVFTPTGINEWFDCVDCLRTYYGG